MEKYRVLHRCYLGPPLQYDTIVVLNWMSMILSYKSPLHSDPEYRK